MFKGEIKFMMNYKKGKSLKPSSEMQTIYLSAAKQTPLRTSDTMHGF